MSTLPDMAVFVLVVEAGSFTAAAQQLGITPSAVSRQISRLEAVLQVQLLERTTRKQTTTSEGVAAYERCRTMVECARDVTAIGSSFSEPSGKICISAPKAYSKTVLQPLVLAFLAENPAIDIHFRVTDTFLNPLRDDVDLVFRLNDHLIEGLVSRPLHTIESHLCASPSFIEQHGVPQHPEDLKNVSCITLGEFEKDNLWVFQRQQHRVQVRVSGRYTTNHRMRLQAIKSNFGIGLFPDFVVKDELITGNIVRVLDDWRLVSKYQGMVSLQYMQNKFMPSRLRRLIDYLIENLSNNLHAK
jgi:DNA-binding transcriptional LysR family regulator